MDKISGKLDMGNVSDGYHALNGPYGYRTPYDAAFLNGLAKGDVKARESHRRHDGGGTPRWRMVYRDGRTAYGPDPRSS